MTESPARAALIVVGTFADVVAYDGVCSLREAIENANDDAITHDDCSGGGGADQLLLDEGTYELAGTPLELLTDIEVIGSGIDETIIDAGGLSGVFELDGEWEFEIRDLTITGYSALWCRDSPRRHGEALVEQRGAEFTAFRGTVIADEGTVTLNNTVVLGQGSLACVVAEFCGAIVGSANADDDNTCPGSVTVNSTSLLPLFVPLESLPIHPLPGNSPLRDAGSAAACPTGR